VKDQASTTTTHELLSPEDVAKRCGLSRRAIYRAIERGELPATRLCSRLRVASDDLEAWLEDNRVEATVTTPLRTVPVRLENRAGLRRFLVDEG
jgi:excisionase family DNA binding protein